MLAACVTNKLITVKIITDLFLVYAMLKTCTILPKAKTFTYLNPKEVELKSGILPSIQCSSNQTGNMKTDSCTQTEEVNYF